MAYSRLAGMDSFRGFAFQPEPSPENDINILLLGETGVGKTTFINALINALFYNTLDEALQNELKVLIPSSFVVTNPETFQSETIAFGPRNENEDTRKPGNSATQACRSFVFRIGNRNLRLIDGPGVGDVRGPSFDEANFATILDYISQYEYLSGICILLKPTANRMNVYFRYCVKELLRHLHISAKDNIMFIFTYARTTFFKPGDTVFLLRSLLNDLREKTGVNVPFERDNTFMIDNETFRFLAVAHQGHNFLMGEKDEFAKSWEKSVEEYVRLVARVLQCDLHAIQDTHSLNEAFQLIQKLARPIGEIIRLIEENIALANNYKLKLLRGQVDKTSLRIPQKVGKYVPVNKKLTVCIADRCTSIVEVDGEAHVEYRMKCHDGCALDSVIEECIGHPKLQKCAAMNPMGTCNHCGCDWQKHMHVTYAFRTSSTHIEIGRLGSSSKHQSIMAIIDARIAALRAEEAAIKRICVELSAFIRVHSLSPVNDDMIEYLELNLNEERRTKGMNGKNSEVIQGLERMINEYKQEISLLTQDLAQKREVVAERVVTDPKTIENIFDRVTELYNLPINGPAIREQVEGIKVSQRQGAGNHDQFINLPSEGPVSRVLITLRTLVNQRRT